MPILLLLPVLISSSHLGMVTAFFFFFFTFPLSNHYQSFFLMLKLSHVNKRTSFCVGSCVSFGHDPITLTMSLLSDPTRYFRFVLSISCNRPGISHSSWFLVVEHNLHTRYAHWWQAIIASKVFREQSWKICTFKQKNKRIMCFC